MGRSKPKDDHLQREQLAPWFDTVRGIQNPVIATYLQCLLLTSAPRGTGRRRWDDVNFQWRSIAMKDKVRIPLIADTHFRLIADSVPDDRGHPVWGA